MTRSWTVRFALTFTVTATVLATQAVAPPGRVTAEAATGPNCGAEILKPNGDPWVCTFASNFNGTTLNPDKWRVLTTGPDVGRQIECRVDSPDNIEVSDGALRLSAVRVPEPVTCPSLEGDWQTVYTAGAVTSSRRFAQTYGRFAVRAKMPPDWPLVGYHSGIWLYPQEPTYGAWPASGEIDVNEYRTGWGKPVPTLHRLTNGQHESFTKWNCLVPKPEEFHTYVLLWTKWKLQFIYDDQLCFEKTFTPESFSTNRPFDHDFFIILTQSFGGGLNSPNLVTPPKGTMVVDYVRAWR